MAKPRSFTEDLAINRFKLEDECERHSAVYFYWANSYADAKTALAAMKDKLDLTYAQQDILIRSSWNEASLGKMTEGSVKARLEACDEVQKVKEELIEAQREVNTLAAATSAMDHRKSELDNLVTLLVKGFYSAPNGGRREDATASAEREVRSKLSKGKKREEE